VCKLFPLRDISSDDSDDAILIHFFYLLDSISYRVMCGEKWIKIASYVDLPHKVVIYALLKIITMIIIDKNNHFSKLFNLEETKGIIHSRIYSTRDVVQSVWYNITRRNFGWFRTFIILRPYYDSSQKNGDPHYLVLQATSITIFYLTVYYF
jgi:hypothetical protein